MIEEYETYEEQRPLFWWRGYPVFAAYFLVLVYVVSMFVCVLLGYLGYSQWLDTLAFHNKEVLLGQVWRVVTFGLVNPMASADIAWQFAIDMTMMAWFGREVERHYGCRKFLFFYSIVYLISPLLLTLLGVCGLGGLGLAGETGALAIFIAFATLYPRTAVFFMVEARWAAIIAVAVYTMVALNNHNHSLLISHWATMAFAFAYVRHHQGRLVLPGMNLFRRGPALRVLPDLKQENEHSPKETPSSSMAEIDALLDKIAQSGISSLTAKERAKLDAARAQMLKRDSSRH